MHSTSFISQYMKNQFFRNRVFWTVIFFYFLVLNFFRLYSTKHYTTEPIYVWTDAYHGPNKHVCFQGQTLRFWFRSNNRRERIPEIRCRNSCLSSPRGEEVYDICSSIESYRTVEEWRPIKYCRSQIWEKFWRNPVWKFRDVSPILVWNVWSFFGLSSLNHEMSAYGDDFLNM